MLATVDAAHEGLSGPAVRRILEREYQLFANSVYVAYQVGFVRLLNSCLTLIVACIIYWQAKDISRVIRTADPERHGIELSLLRHVSPIKWDNMVLYGEYVLNRRLVRRSGSRP